VRRLMPSAALAALLTLAALAGATAHPPDAQGWANGRAPWSELQPVFIPSNTAFLTDRAAAAWNTMRLCAVRDGVDLYPSASSWQPAATAYRTYAAQLVLWRRYKAGTGALAAVPGTSNHGLGKAVDLGLPRMRTWIDAHGREYGWRKLEAFGEWWHVGPWQPGFKRPDPGTSLRFPNLRRGSGGRCQAPAVREVQRRLGVARDGDYGPRTVAAVRTFQREHKMRRTGRVESKDWLRIRKASRGLENGHDPRTVADNLPGQSAPAAGQDVRAVQGLLNSRLVELGRPEWRIKVDGKTDARFTQAVKRFQRLRHLKATGRVDDATYAALLKKVRKDEPRLAVSPEGTNLIADFEGLRLCSYRDVVGVWTVGYGHTAAAGAPRPRAGLCLPSKAEAVALLHRDLDRYSKGVAKLVRSPTSSREYNAMLSLSYNVGTGAFGSSTLLRLHNGRHYAGAAAQFKRWNRAGGRPLAGLTRRRGVECALYVRGSTRAVQQRRPCR
jgi:lysozyme